MKLFITIFIPTSYNFGDSELPNRSEASSQHIEVTCKLHCVWSIHFIILLRVNTNWSINLYDFCSLLLKASTLSVCSRENRNTTLSSCLRQIRNTVQDKTKFWFGTDYARRCPIPMSSFDCSNFLANQTDSIVSRVFGSSYNFDPNVIDRYIDVQFTSMAGMLEHQPNI